MAKRIDIHAPSVIIPTDYEFVAFDHIKVEGIGDCFVVIENRRRIEEHMKRTGGTHSTHDHAGNCGICGSVNAIYTALFYHAPTNTYIRTGQDCADKLEFGYGNMDAFRAAIKDASDLHSGKRKAEATLAGAGLARAWQIHLDYLESLKLDCENEQEFDAWTRSHRDETTVHDIVGKLIKYGAISEAQTKFLATLLDRIARKPQIEAERAAERALAADCPTGRIKVTGTIVSVKEYESDFGVTLKMTVKATEGFLVYVTVPSGLEAERGKEVSFTATITPSPTDPKFGIGKRPIAA